MKIKRQRNRRRSQKRNVMTGGTFHAALFIASLLVMVVLNIVADSRCSQARASICEKKKELARLELSRQRESASWSLMTTEGNLENALVHNGLNMNYPKSEQIINMNASGIPRQGQRSVDLAKARISGTVPVASNATPRRRRTVRR